MNRHELAQQTEKRPLELQCASNVHDPAEAFFEFANVYVLGRSDVPSPSGEPCQFGEQLESNP